MTLHRIKASEIKPVARLMSECFADYPLYDALLPKDEKRLRRIFYYLWYLVYTRRSFTYVTDSMDAACCIRKPGEKECSGLGIFLNPVFFFGFFRNVPLRYILRVLEFHKIEDANAAPYYHPDTDWYFQTLCVFKGSRANGTMLRLMRELDEGAPIYCETHSERNAALYRHFGLKVCHTLDFHGITHYIMRRGPVEEGTFTLE